MPLSDQVALDHDQTKARAALVPFLLGKSFVAVDVVDHKKRTGPEQDRDESKIERK